VRWSTVGLCAALIFNSGHDGVALASFSRGEQLRRLLRRAADIWSNHAVWLDDERLFTWDGETRGRLDGPLLDRR
jgi:hypothetical protein